MAHTLSAKKRIRQSEKRKAANNEKKSRVRTIEKKLRKLVAEKKLAEAEKAYSAFSSAIDKAAKTKIFHKNKAARKKSRLALLLNKAKKEQSAATG